MEDVLDVYERPYDPRYPQVCLDETSKQLIGEVRAALPMTPDHCQKYDGEYVRNGTANLFIATEPLAGWRHVDVWQAHFVRNSKCKLESTDVSEATVRNSLETARQQLPGGHPGVVFLKIPQEWFTESGLGIVSKAVARFLRTTNRVISVKVYGTLISVDGETVLQVHRINEFRNDKPALIHYGDVDIFREPLQGVGSIWTELITI